MMLNLSEDWKRAYSEYLLKEEANFSNELDETFAELSEARESAQKSFSMLREYYEIFALTEGVTLSEAAKEGDSLGEDGKGGYEKVGKENNTKTPSPSLVGELVDILKTVNTDEEKQGYKATQQIEITSIQDMKFPKNVIFFIGQLIKWIRNLVLYFIEKFKNLIRRLVGAQPKELNPEAIKLNLDVVKKLETISTVATGNLKNGVVSARKIDSGKLEQMITEGVITEGFAEDLGIVKYSRDRDAVKTQPIIVTIDLARDIQNIRTLTDHFYKLFDNAYGSANEHLFGTDDLEIILNIFNDTIARLKTGNIAQYSVSGGVAVDAPGINSERVKQNLKMTNENLNNLKNAYTQTAQQIEKISKIIHTKEMLMLSDIGASYRLLSTGTFQQMLPIVETIPARLKKAAEMERKLAKMKSEYSALVQELQRMQTSFATVSNVTFDTIYNRKIVDLLNAASWMSDTVSLRLTGIGLYIKELKDVRDALVMVSDLNAAPRGGKLKDFVEQGRRAELSRKLYKNY